MKIIKLLLVDKENNVRLELDGFEDNVNDFFDEDVKHQINKGDKVYRFYLGVEYQEFEMRKREILSDYKTININ
jgi:hypothetical protein